MTHNLKEIIKELLFSWRFQHLGIKLKRSVTRSRIWRTSGQLHKRDLLLPGHAFCRTSRSIVFDPSFQEHRDNQFLIWVLLLYVHKDWGYNAIHTTHILTVRFTFTFLHNNMDVTHAQINLGQIRYEYSIIQKTATWNYEEIGRKKST